MAQALIVPVTAAHVADLAWRMRPADVAEVRASAGLTPRQAVKMSVDASEVLGALEVGGELLAICGAATITRPPTLLGEPPLAALWALTTTSVEHHKRTFMACTRPIIAALLERYPVLVNAIDARNAAALRWARWAGFDIQPAIPFGVAGHPFHPIRITRSSHV